MTLLQLSYFIALADNLHYTKTADALHISQPSLSYAISELEKSLGVPLFKVEKRNISLTPYGRLFYPYALKSMNILQTGVNSVKAAANTEKTVVRMGYFHSISTTLIPNLIGNIRRELGPDEIAFELVEDSVPHLLSMLKRGELDFCFSCHQESWAECAHIACQPLYLVVPNNHTLANRRTVSFQDFSAEPQVMLSRGSDLRAQLDQLFQEHKVIPQIAIETRECNAALQYVSLNFGVSVLPQVPMMDRENLRIIPITFGNAEDLSRNIYLVWEKQHQMSVSAYLTKEYILDKLAE